MNQSARWIIATFAIAFNACSPAPKSPSGSPSAVNPAAVVPAASTPTTSTPTTAVPNSGVEQADFATPGGRLGGHGMVVFGDSTGTWMSHIPMFHAPHDAQVIFKVALSGLNSAPVDLSGADCTFSPDSFSLNDMVTGRIKTFRGALFKGNFEQGGTEVAKQVEVTVVTVLVARALREQPAKADAISNEFFLIAGVINKHVDVHPDPAHNEQSAWAIHRITTAPGFDLVTPVKLKLKKDQSLTTSSKLYKIYNEQNGEVLEMPTSNLSARFGLTLTDVTDHFDGKFNVIGSCLLGPDFVKPCP